LLEQKGNGGMYSFERLILFGIYKPLNIKKKVAIWGGTKYMVAIWGCINIHSMIWGCYKLHGSNLFIKKKATLVIWGWYKIQCNELKVLKKNHGSNLGVAQNTL
jgi:hypothetical protein